MLDFLVDLYLNYIYKSDERPIKTASVILRLQRGTRADGSVSEAIKFSFVLAHRTQMI